MEFYVAVFFLFLAVIYIGRKMDNMSDRLHEASGSIIALAKEHKNDQSKNDQNIKELQEARVEHSKILTRIFTVMQRDSVRIYDTQQDLAKIADKFREHLSEEHKIYSGLIFKPVEELKPQQDYELIFK